MEFLTAYNFQTCSCLLAKFHSIYSGNNLNNILLSYDLNALNLKVVTPNESETFLLSALAIKHQDQAQEVAKILLDHGVKTGFVTLGA